MDAWAAWIERELPNAEADARARALAAARQALDRGGSPPDAALAAAVAALQPRGALTADGIAEVQAQLEAQRVAALTLRQAPPPLPAPPAPPRPAPAPGPSMRELFSENSVLILGMTGAFLLVVATVLFELYGAAQLGGWVRFGAVVGLAAAFGVASWFCLRSARLRVVGQVYLAVFALLAPLACVAAYTFLDLRRQGISIPTAIGLSGLACALLYAALSWRLRAAPYAWLAAAALLAGWAGAADAAFGQPSAGPATAVLLGAYALAAAAAPRRFRLPAKAFLHTPWIPALALTNFDSRAAVLTLLLVAAGYLAHTLLQRRAGWLLPAAVALTAALAWLDNWQNWAPELAAGQLVVLAAVLIAVSWWVPGVGPKSATWLRIAAALEIGIAALVQPRHPALEAAAAIAGTALLVLMARRQRSWWWLAAATPVLAMAWYWSGVALLPPPPHPAPDNLAQLFLPLPALLGLAGIALRLRLGKAWGDALGGPAALGGLGVAALAAGSGDFQLAGAALIVYGCLAYLAGALARKPGEVGGGLGAMAAGVLALLAGRGAPAAGYVVVAAAGAAAVYALQEAWRRAPALKLVHRWGGLGALAFLVTVDLTVPDLYAPHAPAGLAAAAAAVALAAVLAVDARLHALPVADYGALAAAGLAPVWLAGWAGAGDPLWFALGPGLALTAGGLRMPYDPRLRRRAVFDRLLVAAGALVLLGPEAVQVVQADQLAGPHMARLLVGGVAGLLGGIALRSRVLVVAGSVGVILAALRALFIALESVQPYVLFGAVALLLLGGAALLAGLRDRVGGARAAVTSSWSDWN
ncbi:MAG TPA: hypothetical protein VF160_09700 [Candidatus Dormibacteraeota bacterium]